MQMNPLAEELNEKLGHLTEMLSEKGKAIFFPKLGILGQTAEAKGKRINATIGIALEDDNTPMRLPSLAKQVNLDPKDIFPYATSFGKPELRKKWQEMIYQKNPSLGEKKISLPVVTNALTHGLSMAGYLFLDDGENIIVPTPFWGNYKLIFTNAYNAKIKTFDCFKDNSAFNIEGLEESLLGSRKKVLLLNFPNNPSGYTPTDEEVTDIVNTIRQVAESGTKIVVLVDDAYFGLVYKEGIYKESIFSELADLHENVLAVKIDGATKEDYVWGFRTGFMTFATKGMTDDIAEAFAAKTAGAIRGNISNAPHISQSLVLKTFSSENYAEEKQEKYDIMKERFKTVKQTFDQHPEYQEQFTPLPFNSGYFMCIKLKQEAEPVRKKLLEHDIGIIAMGDIIRIAYSAVKKENIPELFETIYNVCKG